MSATKSLSMFPVRAFSSSAVRPSFARLTLAGNLVETPKRSLNKNGKPFWVFKIATNDPPTGPNADGTFPERTTTFHSVLSYLDKDSYGNLPKGSLVHVDAAYKKTTEKRDDNTYNESTFLKLDKLEVLKRGQAADAAPAESSSSSF